MKMTYAGHARAITIMGLPLVGGHLGQVAIGVTDTVMVGWYSVEGLAAVTLASTYFFVLLIFGSGFAWGVMPMVAAFDAEGDEVGLRRATRMGLWLSLGFALLALPLFIWSGPIMGVMGQEPELAEMVRQYLMIAGWGIIPALLVMVLKSYLAALERTQVVFWITIFSAVVNALANYMFIFGNWGAPELGVRGAAIASLTSHSASLLAVVIYVLKAMPEHQIFVRLWRPDWEMLARVFRLGLPIGVTGLSEVGLFAASAVMMGWLGTIALAAHGIALQLASITFMIHLGISNVATIRAGNAFGRRDPAHLVRGAVTATTMSLLVAAATIVGFVLWPGPDSCGWGRPAGDGSAVSAGRWGPSRGTGAIAGRSGYQSPDDPCRDQLLGRRHPGVLSFWVHVGAERHRGLAWSGGRVGCGGAAAKRTLLDDHPEGTNAGPKH